MSNEPREPGADFGFERVSEAEKGRRVRGVFSSVASRYDLMNDLMSGGVHRLWKDAFVGMLAPTPRMSVIDCAGGTGDVAFRIIERSRRGPEAAQVCVIDINEEMLRAGRTRSEAKALNNHLAWAVGTAEALPMPDRSADAYTIAFGIRNVTHRDKALAEARRVLKLGGRFLCLEFSSPVVPLIDTLYERFSFEVIPAIGRLVAKDEASYRYLVESIRKFPSQEAFAREMTAAGFSRASFRNLSGGIAAIHSAWVV